MGVELLVQVLEQDPRLGRDHAGVAIEAAQPVEAGEIEHQAAGQGHALAVVARGRSPQGEAHPLAAGGRRHPQNLVNAVPPHQHLGAAAREQRR